MNEPRPDSGTQYLRGVAMAMITTALWGVLPIMQKIALKEFSPGTIVWFRFLFAFAVLYPLLHLNRSNPRSIILRPPLLGIAAGISLAANYLAVVRGIHFSSPSNAAILIQTAPVLLTLVGVGFFREGLGRRQVLGFVVAVAGFFLFYTDQKSHSADAGLYDSANLNILLGGFSWVAFMVCQKLLSKDYEPQSLNMLVYGVAAIVLLPGVQWTEFEGVGAGYWTLMVFLGLNTLIAYGALAEAVKRIPLSHLSVLITLNPLITVFAMRVLTSAGSSWVAPEMVGVLGYLGAVTAIAGVVMVVWNR
ncbi:MAG: DMT family transporter [Nitrospinae bacterium]|nr:DMT family transporter [Nitrospinota bacterium]